MRGDRVDRRRVSVDLDIENADDLTGRSRCDQVDRRLGPQVSVAPMLVFRVTPPSRLLFSDTRCDGSNNRSRHHSAEYTALRG